MAIGGEVSGSGVGAINVSVEVENSKAAGFVVGGNI
jgi:hypothetical protein